MTSPATPSNPGWWPDPDAPTDQLRYFDGIVWTSHTTSLAPPPRPVEAAPPAPAPTTPARDTARPSHSRAGQDDHAPDGRRLASYGQRVGAWVLDGLIKLALTLVLGGWAVYLALRPQFEQIFADVGAGRTSSISPFEVTPDPFWMSVYGLIQALIGLVYSVWFLTRERQATPGKRAMNIEVARTDGHRIDVATAAKRYAIPFVNLVSGGVAWLGSLTLGVWVLDHLLPAWDPRRQALHDKLAGTQVVVTEPRTDPFRDGPPGSSR